MSDFLFGDLSPSTAILGILLGMLLAVVMPRLLKPTVTASGEKKEYMDLVSNGQVLFDDNRKEGQTCVHSAQIFEKQVDFNAFSKQFCKIYGSNGRFGQRLVNKGDERPYWIKPDPYWRPEDNISCVTDRTDHKGFEEMLGKMCATPLPLSQPLWQLVYFQNYVREDNGELTSAFIWKYHHSMADGFTAMRHTCSHCVPVAEGQKMEDVFIKPKAGAKRSRPSLLTIAKKTVTAFCKLVFLPKDPVSPCKPNYTQHHGSKRATAFTYLGEEFSVAKIKEIAHSATTTDHKKSVNDVLLAAISRALGMYCEEKKDKVENVKIPENFQSAMWVSLDRASPFKFEKGERRWGNEGLGVCYLSLPIGVKSAVDQLNIVYHRIRDLIGSPEPLLANKLQALIALLPYPIAHFLWPRVTDKVTLSISNVPGPQAQLRWPVNRDEDLKEQIPRSGIIRDMLFFVPPVYDIGIMASIISYNNRVNVGMTTAGEWIDQDDVHHIIYDLVPRAMRDIRDGVASCENTE
ncbi:hypothetical protein FOZ60_013205 [Perkinsus olseni]|uniref:O-acyltransferase WSD1 C-terminal domain-containing protein n=1 Tax=Perkinsus olseni TaxID=32597 RepID=A0A7J6P8V1_PEROL|nr:hypothetical protein FOZ60_013205 [Perkinsus olseni]